MAAFKHTAAKLGDFADDLPHNAWRSPGGATAIRGRKPIPEALAALHGHPRDHGRRHEPQAPGTVSDPPDWLSESQREIWLHAVESAPLGVLKAIDSGLLTIYVIASDLHRQASEQLQAEGLVTDDGRANPLASVVTKQALVVMKAASELAFTPIGRARLGMTQPEEGPPEPGSLREWLAKGDELHAKLEPGAAAKIKKPH